METGKRKDWREEESVDEAVRRLIGVMDERKKRRASGAQSPEKIADPSRNSPCVPKENGGQSLSANSVGSAALKGSGRQSTVAGGACDGYGSWLGSCVCDASMRQPAPCAGPNESGFTVEAQFEDEAWNVRDGSE